MATRRVDDSSEPEREPEGDQGDRSVVVEKLDLDGRTRGETWAIKRRGPILKLTVSRRSGKSWLVVHAVRPPEPDEMAPHRTWVIKRRGPILKATVSRRSGKLWLSVDDPLDEHPRPIIGPQGDWDARNRDFEVAMRLNERLRAEHRATAGTTSSMPARRLDLWNQIVAQRLVSDAWDVGSRLEQPARDEDEDRIAVLLLAQLQAVRQQLVATREVVTDAARRIEEATCG